ncbi:MerR family transcriptional regulator [Fulvivirga sp. 29W222]|uniref:MerR family transcriptional regulator n=1 Tax=Fulvivirga marina TaxID=2494733 RepID=A0A937G3K3_9BACT|nr:MerR family transcriptional regulator [Fulvivirga marina]MBL6449646.1 MerR family transcriptional regulator [Fulvivirga marina]
MLKSLEDVFSIEGTVKAIQFNRIFNGEPLLSVTDTGVHNRTIDTWDSKKLIITPRKNKGVHRKFNFLEFVWIRVLADLQNIGVKNKVLKRTKRELFFHVDFKIMNRLVRMDKELVDGWPDSSDKEELLEIVKSGVKRKRASKQFNLFQLLVSKAIFSKEPVNLLIFSDGGWLPLFDDIGVFSTELKEKILYESHICISLTRIIREFFAHPKAGLIINELNLFTPVELKVLQIISSGEYNTIEVTLLDDNKRLLEKSAYSGLKLVDYLVEGNYKNIRLNAPGGMMVIVENTKISVS